LDAREERIRAGRNSHNEWLNSRDKEQLPDFKNKMFVDYLKPMVIVSLNAGIRRGSLFGLRWNDVNFQEDNLTVVSYKGKVRKIIHVPMNCQLKMALYAWKEQTGGKGDEFVFASPKTGTGIDNCKSAWKKILKDANIEKFRWHDMRHDFASQLVMRGNDLNTVRELLGHSDLKMTLRYAHLAPKAKRAAVESLSNVLEE
jgi:integrase